MEIVISDKIWSTFHTIDLLCLLFEKEDDCPVHLAFSRLNHPDLGLLIDKFKPILDGIFMQDKPGTSDVSIKLSSYLSFCNYFRKFSSMEVPFSFSQLVERTHKFVYVSGWQPTRPIVYDATLITPAWNWVQDRDIILSGVNFVKILSKNGNRNTSDADYKTYKFCFFGSSSLNKNAVGILLCVLWVCIVQIIGRREPLSGIMVVKNFYGWRSKIIWPVIIFLSFLINCLNSKIEIKLLINDLLKHSEVNDIMKKSKFCIIPYFREGFPRIIGESILNNSVPIVSRQTSFASQEFDNWFPRHGFFDVAKLLLENETYTLNVDAHQAILLSQNSIFTKFNHSPLMLDRPRCSDKPQLCIHLIYCLMTGDLSWLQEGDSDCG